MATSQKRKHSPDPEIDSNTIMDDGDGNSETIPSPTDQQQIQSQPQTTSMPTPPTVLITGCTGGIGTATALLLASSLSANIAIHYHANSTKAAELADELQLKHGVEAEIFQGDLGNYDDVRRLHREVEIRMGDIDVLFNNAGTTGGISGVKGIEEVSIEVMERTWRVNTGSAFLLTQLCLPSMVEKGWGRIIYNSSVAAFTGGLVGPHYASSKSGLHGLVHWVASRYAGKGVTVNAVAPALIEETDMLPGGNVELAKRIPVGRLGKPMEVAETVLWLVKVGYVSNKIVTVDGGMIAR